MEPASISIKFTPIVKNVQKNDSKCFLEIVPEVTCIQNLDRIEWYQKSDFIEYIIPMTYKVILRKRQSLKETKDDMVKIYHSCVDLLPRSSLTCNNPASGHITRIISDTVIFLRGNVYSDNFQIKKNAITLDSIDDIEDEFSNEKADPNTVNKLERCSNYKLHTVEDQKINNKALMIDASTSQLNVNVKELNSGKAISVNNIHLNNNVNVASIDNVTRQTSDSSNTNKKDSTRKLSLTPICSIDTNEELIIHDNSLELLSWDTIIRRVLESQNAVTYPARITDLSLENPSPNLLNKNFKQRSNDVYEELVFKTYKRERPDVRVAKFIKNMETELLPIKIMLNDILKKCSSMGLINKNPNSKKTLGYRNDTGKQLLKYCKREKQIKSNRVVYSIVFDE